MKKRSVWLVLLGFSIGWLGLAGCGFNAEPEAASALWAKLQQANYQQWKPVPGFGSAQPAKQPFTDFLDPRPLLVKIYMNDVVEKALASKKALSTWPVGSLLVKEGYQGDDFKALVVMEKREDGWFWAQWSKDGDASHSGKPADCVDCHLARKDHDMTVTLSLPR